MVQICSRCARANPEEALYCYFDGSALGGRSTNGGPINTGTQPFHSPFTFPTGRTCRDFDELALACQENWSETLELLQQGYLENFLGGLGRADLALAARAAARFPDTDRGLDQFLAKLPGDVVDAPKLEVEPTVINLGELQVGQDRELELHLCNKGMRLLYGAVVCDNCVWLTVGEVAGASQKLFQFTHELDIPVHIRGKYVRAGPRPLEGRLLVESNGGTSTVVVRADVPVKPFAEGILAGARSPRQLAEKAKMSPKEAAPLFEKGAVTRWYEDNGWTYPVQGPVASDMGAVQQFFEALGLTRPPRVEIAQQAIALQGNVGIQLQEVIEIKTTERRPVYAHAASDQPWLEVGPARLHGRHATIPLLVPAVPDREGETLQAKVTIIANGNQRFTIPVMLGIGANLNFESVSSGTVAQPVTLVPAPLQAQQLPPLSVAAGKLIGLGSQWIHAVPAVALGLVLFLVIMWDLVTPRKIAEPFRDDDFTSFSVNLDDPEPRIGVKFNSSMRFGILMLKERDPNNPEEFKRLTAKDDGWSNNTCIRLDGHEHLFGLSPGEWLHNQKTGQSLKQVRLGANRNGWISDWYYPLEHVRVRQTVAIVPNEQTRLLDTCLIHYLIENHDKTLPHKVGIRVMLDTFIGASDGVPFAIPGQPGLLDTMMVFDQKSIPASVEALEQPDLKDPGTIARLGLKLQNVKIRKSDPELEPLETLVLCQWPGNSEKRWKWEYEPMNANGKKDSCVVLYWEDQLMEAGARRAMAFTYGLGRMSSSTGQLGLTVSGTFRPGKVFTVTAYVKDPKDGQRIKLQLPKGLSLDQEAGEQVEEQSIEGNKDYSQVSWRVRAGDDEKVYTLEVSSGRELERTKVQIRKVGLFN
jgi:hypothetical protein